MKCGYDGASGTCDVCTGGIGNCVEPRHWSVPMKSPSIHSTAEDYWALKNKSHGFQWSTLFIAFVTLILILLAFSKVHGADSQIMKVVVSKITSNPNNHFETRPVPVAQVHVLHGKVDPNTATHGLWSAPTDYDGVIIAGIRDGIYTIAVEIDGKMIKTQDGEFPVITIKGNNGLIKYIVAAE